MSDSYGETQSYGPVLAAVIAWADAGGVSWEGDSENDVVKMEFQSGDCSYTTSAHFRDGDTLTIMMCVEISQIINTLIFRDRLDVVIAEMKYGAFFLTTEKEVSCLVWRDSITSDDDDDFDTDIVDELIECGHEAFQLARERLSDFFGINAADVRLMGAIPRGSA